VRRLERVVRGTLAAVMKLRAGIGGAGRQAEEWRSQSR
jgi:hypothetical protein